MKTTVENLPGGQPGDILVTADCGCVLIRKGSNVTLVPHDPKCAVALASVEVAKSEGIIPRESSC